MKKILQYIKDFPSSRGFMPIIFGILLSIIILAILDASHRSVTTSAIAKPAKCYIVKECGQIVYLMLNDSVVNQQEIFDQALTEIKVKYNNRIIGMSPIEHSSGYTYGVMFLLAPEKKP